MAKTRQPIVTVMGHVDHGKTTLLDTIRGTTVASREAGAITQAIGASIIPADILKKVCGPLLDSLKIKLTIPGILFIDTPGHAAFTNLRKRGGNLADIAIVVVDINEGFMPQTLEALEILKQYKTPFIIAVNKIDLIQGWSDVQAPLLKKLDSQSDSWKRLFDIKFYELVGKLYDLGFNSERFDRVEDFTKQIALVPVSAKFNVGIPELLMVLSGLAQRYLEQTLKFEVGGFAKGTVLEVKEEKGLGTTVDVIIYDGSLKKNDTIVIGGLEKPIVTKVKALLEPAPLSEMRDKKGKYNNVNEVSAATGVKISAPDLTGVVAGTPLRSCSKEDLEKIKSEVQAEVDEVLIETDESGIIVKADSLGSVEALINLLKGANITIRRASVGDISKKDISEAQSNYEKDPFTAVIIGFNVTLTESVPDTVKVITGNIIYTIMDKYVKWKEELTKLQEMKKLDVLVRPCKLMLMPNYVFRQNNPAIVGTEVLEGVLRPNTPLMNSEGKLLTTVKGIQHEGENLEKAEKGKQVAVSYPDVTVGRQVKEGDILYSAIPEDDFRKLKKLKQYLSKGELEIMREIADIMRKINVVWGV